MTVCPSPQMCLYFQFNCSEQLRFRLTLFCEFLISFFVLREAGEYLLFASVRSYFCCYCLQPYSCNFVAATTTFAIVV